MPDVIKGAPNFRWHHRTEVLISVVIPCYNVEDCVGRAVESVFAQNYPELEVICVDNNSSDGTRAQLNRLKAKYPALVIASENKAGAPAARNKGLSLCKGVFVQFLDADDELLPGKIEHQFDLVSSVPEVSFVAASYFKKFESGKKVMFAVDPDMWSGLILGRLGITSSNLFRRKDLMNVGGWDEGQKSSQEAMLMFMLLKRNPAVIIDSEPLTMINERIKGSISFSDRAGNWSRFLELRTQIWKHLDSINQLTQSREIFLRQIIFDSVRIQYQFDRNLAIDSYKSFVKGTFDPVESSVTGKIYLLCRKVLGFEFTENIYHWWSGLKVNKS